MPTFTEEFNIPQPRTVAFVDIPLTSDLEQFIDPFLIANFQNFPINAVLFRQLRSFFTKLNRDFIMPNARVPGLAFLDYLHEPNEYHLGYSPDNTGSSVSDDKAKDIFDFLRGNRFAQQGIAVNEAHNVLLLVKGIGPDIMSDVIANVCRNEFADFTTQQCQLHNIPTSPFQMHFYDVNTETWITQVFQLPSYDRKQIILTPRFDTSVQRQYGGYYNWFVAKNHIAPAIINGTMIVNNQNDFVKTSDDGTKKAIVRKIFDVYKKRKGDLVDFVLLYPRSLDEFLAYAKEHYPAADLSEF